MNAFMLDELCILALLSADVLVTGSAVADVLATDSSTGFV